MSDLAKRPHVVIVGAGFGGLAVAKQLANDAHVRVTIVDRQTVHTFQPLLYQVATASLASGDIAEPVRAVLATAKNIATLQGEVVGVDRARQEVRVTAGGESFELHYDYLVLAPGMVNAYFNHQEWEASAPGLKTLADALRLRSQLLGQFERAELPSTSVAERQRLLTFVIVGGGPTGVELSGALADLTQRTLRREFRQIDTRNVRIILLEGSAELLGQFPAHVGRAARDRLSELGVDVRVATKVESITGDVVTLSDRSRIEAGTVIWAAGVRVAALGAWLGEPVDKLGRITVQPDCSLPTANNIFIIGDAARLEDHGAPLPGLAPVALQQGAYVAGTIVQRIGGYDASAPFAYFDKGNLAVVGRNFAVGAFGKLTLTGFLAWLLWSVVHLAFLVTFRNRFWVFLEWAWVYVTDRRGSRVLLPHHMNDAAKAGGDNSFGSGAAHEA